MNQGHFVSMGIGSWARWLALAAACATLAGCATPRRNLYDWSGYQVRIYEHMKGQGSPAEQIEALEKSLQVMSSKGTVPPPGYVAHLGMLYLSIGNTDQAARMWTQEKTTFPESKPFMDYLLDNLKKKV